MKTMTCKQLWWACDKEFHAETFDEMAEQSKLHWIEMMQENDTDHMDAMRAMMEMMKEPWKVEAWFASKQQEFDDLPTT